MVSKKSEFLTSKSSRKEIEEYLGFANLIPLNSNKTPAVKKLTPYFIEKKPINPDVEDSIAYGVVCGCYARLVVLDFDSMDGLECFLVDYPEFCFYFHNTMVVNTRRGFHVYFRSSNLPSSFKSSKFGGIDIQSNGKYVVGLGSVISKFKYDSSCEPHKYTLAPESACEILDLDEFSGVIDDLLSALRDSIEGDNDSVDSDEEYLSDIAVGDDSFPERLFLDENMYQSLLIRIGLRDKVLLDYLEMKKYSFLGKRSDYDFDIVRLLVITGLGDAEIFAFYYRVNNLNVKACERLEKSDKAYLWSIINKLRGCGDKLHESRENKLKDLKTLKQIILETEAAVLFPKESKCMQKRLHGTLIIIIDYCIRIGFLENVYLSGDRIAKIANCGKTTGYKRLSILCDKYNYLKCVRKGCNYTEKASQFNIELDEIARIGEGSSE